MSRLSDFIRAAGAGLDISALTQNALTEDRVAVFEESGTWTAPDDGYLFIRGWGAGGGGANSTSAGNDGGESVIDIGGVGVINITGGKGGGYATGTGSFPTLPRNPGGSVSTMPADLINLLYHVDGQPSTATSGASVPSFRLQFPLSVPPGSSTTGIYGGGGGGSDGASSYEGGQLGGSGRGTIRESGSGSSRVYHRIGGGAGGAVILRSPLEVRSGSITTITIGAGGYRASNAGILLDFWTYDEVDALIIAEQG